MRSPTRRNGCRRRAASHLIQKKKKASTSTTKRDVAPSGAQSRDCDRHIEVAQFHRRSVRTRRGRRFRFSACRPGVAGILTADPTVIWGSDARLLRRAVARDSRARTTGSVFSKALPARTLAQSPRSSPGRCRSITRSTPTALRQGAGMKALPRSWNAPVFPPAASTCHVCA